MFPLHQGNELCFKISSNPHEEHKILQDLMLTHASVGTASTDIANNYMGKGRRRKLIPVENNKVMAKDDNSTSNNKKKILHRNIERQRRQEMATLYTSLRSLLPLEYIKGKRSISDHMNEAVNYIKHQQMKIKQLGTKRDELKKLSNISSSDALATEAAAGSSNTCSQSSSVTIRPCLEGMEIVVVSDLREQELPLSRVLKVILEEGASVVNCVTTKVNEKLLHSVQTQVNDPTCLNLPELQQKITSAVSSRT
ncbi:hypothetical protein Tsubulata_043741 [Turnera subulata]|uniref:BHLH domain-containing protein n=1 Tax=Turnera subulata TaxID=218843 RepID=A0A9Q0FG62_9ROSI|nr:hypothetical protein Tsubulata_043741 [Turnera subulata]